MSGILLYEKWRMKLSVLDRVQIAVSMITKVDERIQCTPSMIHAPIRLVKEAEQQVPAPVCVICGSKDHLEKHHVAGRVNYPDTITLCEQCHNQLSYVYQPKWLPWVHGLPCYLLGWSDIFHLIWQKTRENYFFELSKTFAQNARYAQ